MFHRELKIATLSCSSSLMQLKELNKRRMYRKSPLRYFSCTTNHLNHSNDIILILGVKSPLATDYLLQLQTCSQNLVSYGALDAILNFGFKILAVPIMLLYVLSSQIMFLQQSIYFICRCPSSHFWQLYRILNKNEKNALLF